MTNSLTDHRERFLGYLRARVRNRLEAEDLLQSAYLRVAAGEAVPPAGHEVAWFYRVLRNLAVDRHRRQQSEARQRDMWRLDPTRQPAELAPGRLCRCTLRALASLKPQYIHIIKEVDLHGRAVADVARAEGLSLTNGYVRLHRARRLLAERLRGLCRGCADNGCADCHCKGSAEPA